MSITKPGNQMTMTHNLAVLLTCGLLAFATGHGTAMTVTNPRCEYRINPLGVDVAQPRLEWNLESSRRGERLTAYQVLAASSQELLDRDKGDLWDNGKVVGATQNQIPYGGADLTSNRQVFWKVRVWDGAAAPTAWSPGATWTMGVLKPDDWQAKWITFGNADAGSTLLRRGFAVKPGLRRAFRFASGAFNPQQLLRLSPAPRSSQ